MAIVDWEQHLSDFRARLAALLPNNADPNSVTTAEHNYMLDPLGNAVEAHAQDQDAHSGSLPTSSKAALLVGNNPNWDVFAAGLSCQFLSTQLPVAEKILEWNYLITNINLIYDNDGYCYNGVEITTEPEAWIAGKNIKIYDPQNNKFVYLTYSASRTFKINLDYSGAHTYGFLVVKKADLLAAASNGNIEISKTHLVLDTDIILMESKRFVLNEIASFASGLLMDLATTYKASNTQFDEVAVAANIATLDVNKYDKITGRFYISHNDNLSILTTQNFLYAEGYIVVNNSAATSKTITFGDFFTAGVFQIPATSDKLFYYYRKTTGSSRFSIIDLTPDVIPKAQEIVFSASPTFDLTKGAIAEMPLTGNTVPAISNEISGGTYIITFAVDATGGYSITPGASFGTKTDNALADIASATANAIYIYTIVVRPDGSKFYTIESIGG